MEDRTSISLSWGYGADVNPPAGWSPMVEVVPVEVYDDGSTSDGGAVASSMSIDTVIANGDQYSLTDWYGKAVNGNYYIYEADGQAYFVVDNSHDSDTLDI